MKLKVFKNFFIPIQSNNIRDFEKYNHCSTNICCLFLVNLNTIKLYISKDTNILNVTIIYGRDSNLKLLKDQYS